MAELVLRFLGGEFLARWGERWTGDLQFQAPVALTIDSVGHIYISDQKNNSVQKVIRYQQ